MYHRALLFLKATYSLLQAGCETVDHEVLRIWKVSLWSQNMDAMTLC